MSCPVCKRKTCIWIQLKNNPEKLPTEELKRVVDHNIGYIEMVFRDGQGGASNEERMYNNLSPYTNEIERRQS